MLKVKTVIWQKNSREWPDAREPMNHYPEYRAVFDGYVLVFEKSTVKDAMGNPVWNSVDHAPTAFVVDFAKQLYDAHRADDKRNG